MNLRALHYKIPLSFCSTFPESINADEIQLHSDILHPFSDYDEIQEVLDIYKEVNWSSIRIEGMIPGTGFVTIKKAGDGTSKTYFSKKQEAFNLQLNIFKYKRLKVFLGLLNKITDLHTYSVEAFAKKLEEKEIFEFVISFAENFKLEYFTKCPTCSSPTSQKLYSHDSQALLGFVTKNSSIYNRCLSCELIYLNPCPPSDELYKIYDEFDRQDFAVSQNFPYDGESQRGKFLENLELPTNCRSLDLGGGIGKFSEYLKSKYPGWVVTHSDFEIKRYPELEKKGIKTCSLNFTNSPIGKNEFDLITMWEVIEHIHPEKLEFVFDNIANALAPGGMYVFSTPNFDSTLCRSFDFYSVCPPFHTFVFSERWLTDFFSVHTRFEIVKIGYCSDFLDDLNGWMDYAAQTAPSVSLRGFASFVKSLNTEAQADKTKLAEIAKGSEVIYCLRRKS